MTPALFLHISNDMETVPGLYLPSPKASDLGPGPTASPNKASNTDALPALNTLRHGSATPVLERNRGLKGLIPTSYLWPTPTPCQLLDGISTLLSEHAFPYRHVHAVELDLANSKLLEPFHPLLLLLGSLHAVSLRIGNQITLGQHMYDRLRMLRSTVTTLGINYNGPSSGLTSQDAFVEDIVRACHGALQGTSVLPDMYWVKTLLLRLPGIIVHPDRLCTALAALAPLLPNLQTVCLLDIATPIYVLDNQTKHAVRQVRHLFAQCSIYGPRTLRYFGWGRWMFSASLGTRMIVSFQEWNVEDQNEAVNGSGLTTLWRTFR